MQAQRSLNAIDSLPADFDYTQDRVKFDSTAISRCPDATGEQHLADFDLQAGDTLEMTLPRFAEFFDGPTRQQITAALTIGRRHCWYAHEHIVDHKGERSVVSDNIVNCRTFLSKCNEILELSLGLRGPELAEIA